MSSTLGLLIIQLINRYLYSFRNKGLIDKYTDDVLDAYARGFVKDVVMGAALRTAANDLALAAAKAAFKAEYDRITAENERVARLHGEEVQEKILKEQQYAKVCGIPKNGNYYTHLLISKCPFWGMSMNLFELSVGHGALGAYPGAAG